MKCPQCQAEVRDDSEFCPHSAATMPRTTEPAAKPPDVSAVSQPNSIAGPSDVSGEGGDFNVSQASGKPAAETGQHESLNVSGLPARGAGPSTHRFKTGEVILGRYRVTGELGQGGMGVVYKCFDQTGGIDVALKALPPELSHNSAEMALVRENFQIIEQLHHPNIAAVKTLEQDAQTGDYFLIMECVEGMDLWRWLQQEGGQASLAETQAVLWHVAEALDYAHSQKIIHRDIKPANVIIRQDGAVKVLDFGLAAQIQTSLARVSQVNYGTSGTGPYMAPEQWRGQQQDAATDQYALAVLAYGSGESQQDCYGDAIFGNPPCGNAAVDRKRPSLPCS